MTQFKKLNPKQVLAIDVIRKHRYTRLYGGARSGKTFITIRRQCYWSKKHPTSKHLIVRRYQTDVRGSVWGETLPKVLASCGFIEGIDYTLNSTLMEVHWTNGSVMVFAGLDQGDRADKVLGREYSTIYVNECSDVTWQHIKLLRTRLAENVGCPNKFMCDLNPTGVSHWSYTVFTLFLDPETREPLDRDLYGSIDINPPDNEALSPEYIKNELESLTGDARRRFLLGEYTKIDELKVFEPTAYFEQEEFLAWAQKVKWENVRLCAGLDLGFNDADAFAIIAFAEGYDDEWVIFEASAPGQTIAKLAEVIRGGIDYAYKLPIPNKTILIYGDTGGGGKKSVADLRLNYQLPILPAYKVHRDFAVRMLADDVNLGRLHIRKKGAFDNEAEQIMWTRQDSGVILQQIDDKVYHPNVMDAILYAKRYLWRYGNPRREANVRAA